MATRTSSNPFAVAIHAVAKAANLSSRELMHTIEQWDLGWDAGNHQKRLSEDQIREIEDRLKVKVLDGLKQAAAKKEAAKSSGRSAARKATQKSAPDAQKKTKPAATSKKIEQTAAKDEDKKAKRAKPAKKGDDATKDDKNSTRPAPKERTPKSEKADAHPDTKADKDRSETKTPANRETAPERPTYSPDEISSQARGILSNILEGMGFAHPRITIDVTPKAVKIGLAGRDIGTIIEQQNASARIDVLEALQLVLQKSLFDHDRYAPKVAIDVLGFRDGRREQLREMADRLSAYVEKTGKVVRIAAMNFIDRRAMHKALGDHKNIHTESVGRGALRALEISKASSRDHHKGDERSSRTSERDASRDKRPARKDAKPEGSPNRVKPSDDRPKDAKKSSKKTDDGPKDTKKSSKKTDDGPKDAKKSSKKTDDGPKDTKKSSKPSDDGGKRAKKAAAKPSDEDDA